MHTLTECTELISISLSKSYMKHMLGSSIQMITVIFYNFQQFKTIQQNISMKASLPRGRYGSHMMSMWFGCQYTFI